MDVSQRAFSLIECLIALSILSLSSISFAKLLILSMHVQQSTWQRVVAWRSAENMAVIHQSLKLISKNNMATMAKLQRNMSLQLAKAQLAKRKQANTCIYQITWHQNKASNPQSYALDGLC